MVNAFLLLEPLDYKSCLVSAHLVENSTEKTDRDDKKNEDT
jgi:hypothetical protein